MKKGIKKLVLSSNDSRFHKMPLKLTNDLDLDGHMIYFIDSSFERDINEAIEEHIEALPRGRLYSYNEQTDVLELIADNLYFPNGLQLMPNKKEILINENTMARIIKFLILFNFWIFQRFKIKRLLWKSAFEWAQKRP